MVLAHTDLDLHRNDFFFPHVSLHFGYCRFYIIDLFIFGLFILIYLTFPNLNLGFYFYFFIKKKRKNLSC